MSSTEDDRLGDPLSRAVSSPAGAGPTNSLTDVRGLKVGHATLDGDGWLTGVTVVLTPPGGATAGVDVRGGAPGTRETDLLDPRNSVQCAHAIMLGGGSAYGLSAAHGVLTRLAALGRGVAVGDAPSHVVPIVPAAILFDLGRGGVFGNYPGAEAGEVAFDAALGSDGGTLAAGNVSGGTVAAGNVGAGTGAVAGQLKGGTGSASAVLDIPVPAILGSGPAGQPALKVTVAALAAVNSAGSVTDERSGVLYGAQFGLPGEFDWLRPPAGDELAAAASLLAGGGLSGGGLAAPPRPRPLNTTIGVIACDASLTKSQCAKLAGVAHDGLARAIRPAHSMFDGDTIFALATGDGPPASPPEFHAILTAAADCFTRAIVHAVLSAGSVTTPGGRWPGYLDLFPSARGR
ncbi:P1 family peptidase [Trebonia kvetii]|uniref:P1 family peptidase n=1 Tax=Trebonia kvetii TaxID=2480626 RepID=UPI001FE7DAC7|nr:P1 family peptidase [Trebonia kvetii]